ncbi:N-acetylmuramoyl-L-alanine amidase [Halobacteriovorax sp. XZX-3]|uniref:N-acetylmuramoyl-L-alanine amidase family protein n=1 Tax=unclassified Halobacteriovorax TaxID=2639665 RepID=UPI0037142D17
MIKNLLLICSILFVSQTFAATVLIDPGHGGEDCGAKAKVWRKKKLNVVCEKDVTLKIAVKLKKYINETKRHRAYLTRTIDKTVSLQKRADMADIIKADIFISIHLNAAEDNSSSGFETYYLNNHQDAAIAKIEAVENRDLEGKQVIINNILTDLVVERVAPESKKLGTKVHDELGKLLTKNYKMKDRGLKPGLFYVLALSKRPSILLEAGFLTNTTEASLVLDDWFHHLYAKYSAKGIISYLDSISGPSLF